MEDLFQDFVKAVKNCKACAIRGECKEPIPPEGPADAQVMIIGRNPGRDEDAVGRPFVGPGGQYLNRFIDTLGLKRKDCWISNACFCMTKEDREPTVDEIKACLEWKKIELKLIRPRIILLLGNPTIRAFFPGLDSVTKTHGYRFVGCRNKDFEFLNETIFHVLFHPGYCLRQRAADNILFREDLPYVKETLYMTGILKVSF